MRRFLLIAAALAALLPGLARADSDVPSLTAGTSLTSATMYLANAGSANNSLGLTTSVYCIASSALTICTGGITDAMLASTFLKINPALGTPVSGVAANLTGLPISTGVSGLGTGVATFLATPSSANLASAVTGKTGSGALVFGTAPSIDGGALSGTFSGNFTLSGTALVLSGAASGTQDRCLGLTAGGVLATSAGACGSGGGGGDVTASGTLTASRLILGGGTTVVSALGSLGTTTTVLHGNAAGAPTFGALSLTADVTGTLPVGNGGLGIASGNAGGVPYFSGSTTIASSAALTANLPMIGGGAGAAPAVGTRSGNTTAFVTTTGPQTSGDFVKLDASGNHVAGGAAAVSVTAGTPNVVVTPSPGTGTFTIGTTAALNTQSGNSAYTILSTDAGKTVNRTNTTTQTDPVPQATGSFASGFSFGYQTGTVGNTLTSTTSTINGIAGATGIKLGPQQASDWFSDGTNWRAALGVPQCATQTGTTFVRDDYTCAQVAIGTGVSGLGTGVATALAVNVGSAGAPVVNGGALGTPSSATLTSATGLPISTGVSGLGTGVATALAVNTGSAGAVLVNGGALGTPSSATLTSATGLPLTTGVTGTLPYGNGGTGATALTNHGAVVAGASSLSTVAPSANGNVLTSNGTDWVSAAPGGGGGGGGLLQYSDNGLTLTAGTRYVPAGGSGVPSTTEADFSTKAPSALTVNNLQVNLSTDPGAGQTLVVTFRKAGADTALTCTVTGGSGAICQDLTNSVSVAQNDLVDWKIVTTGTFVATPSVTILANSGTTNNGIIGSGTANTIAKFSGSASAGNSSITDDGTTVTMTAGAVVAGASGTVGSYTMGNGTSGTMTIRAPATGALGSSVVTVPIGSTDFSATGGTSQFVKQASAGAALTVARPACADLSDGGTGCSTTVGTAATAATGTSAHTLGFLDGANTYSAAQTFGETHGTTYAPTLTSNNYTADTTDCGKTLLMPTGTTPTLTVPNLNASCTIVVVQNSATQFTVVAASGGSVVSVNSYTKSKAQNAILFLTIITPSASAAKWALAGDGA